MRPQAVVKVLVGQFTTATAYSWGLSVVARGHRCRLVMVLFVVVVVVVVMIVMLYGADRSAVKRLSC